MFVVSTKEDSQIIHKELLDTQIELLNQLGLHYRVLDMPTNDLGAAAYRKYDIEAWMPSHNGFGEITSCSNCTDYQSRRLNIRYREKDALQYAHTLNATAIAIPRILLSILETHQQKDGSVHLPPVLHPYMNGTTIIKPKQKAL